MMAFIDTVLTEQAERLGRPGHGALAALGPTAVGMCAARIAAGDHLTGMDAPRMFGPVEPEPADYDAEDPYLARITAEREPVFRSCRGAHALTEDEALQAVFRFAEQLGVLDLIEVQR